MMFWDYQESLDAGKRVLPLRSLWLLVVLPPFLALLFHFGEEFNTGKAIGSVVAIATYTLVVGTAVHLAFEATARIARRWKVRSSFGLSVLHLLTHTVVQVSTSYLLFPPMALVCGGVHGHEFSIVMRGWLVSVAYIVAVAVVAAHLRQTSRAETREQKAKTKEVEASLAALQSRVNPHFLFNGLNTIAALIDSDQSRAEDATIKLATLYRDLVEGSKEGFVSLGREIEFARHYLDFEQERFGERLRVRFELSPECLDVQIPALVLQPLVENAVVHGVARRRLGGDVLIEIRKNEQTAQIRISNSRGDSHQADERKVAGTSSGLKTTQERLVLVYGDAASCSLIDDGNDRVVCVVEIPFVQHNLASGTWKKEHAS